MSAYGANPAVYASAWLAEHSPRNATVFTCDWDDAPELWFYNHVNRYLVFLDPTYMYAWRPQLFEVWRDIYSGENRDPATAIESLFEAEFGYCTPEYTKLRMQLERDPRVHVVGIDPRQPFVFRIYDNASDVPGSEAAESTVGEPGDSVQP